LVESAVPIDGLDLIGGDPAIDFVNTLGGPLEGPWDDEWLPGYGELVAWSRHAGLLGPPEGATLVARAAARPSEAAAAHGGTLALRAALYDILAALARREAPPAPAAAVVAHGHLQGLAHARLDARGHRLEWTWAEADLRLPSWLVAAAAMDLLRSGRLARLKQCRHCRWLFLDASKNRSRRWCSMAHCGTGAKVRRTRQRRHAARREE
jgi:predicted RNA-binding Zn ribbon-like protein